MRGPAVGMTSCQRPLWKSALSRKVLWTQHFSFSTAWSVRGVFIFSKNTTGSSRWPTPAFYVGAGLSELYPEQRLLQLNISDKGFLQLSCLWNANCPLWWNGHGGRWGGKSLSSSDRLLGGSPLITEPLAAVSLGVSSSHSLPDSKTALAEY